MGWLFRSPVAQAMIVVAVVAAALAAARWWDYHRRAPASTKLLDPLLKFHAQQEQF